VLREKLAGPPAPERVKLVARSRPGDLASPAEAAKAAMATAARRHQALAAEIARLGTALETLLAHAAPAGFRDRTGVGTRAAATLLVTASAGPACLARWDSIPAPPVRCPDRCTLGYRRAPEAAAPGKSGRCSGGGPGRPASTGRAPRRR
jgi:hypothetical protein